MKARLLFFLLLPFSSPAQKDWCRPLERFWDLGATITYPREAGAAIGFRAGHNRQLLYSGLFVGLGVEAIRFQEPKAWYVPLTLNLAYLPLNRPVGPAVVLAPGYGLYRQPAAFGEKEKGAGSGFTFYAGGGMAIGNALFTAGYRSFQRTNSRNPTRGAGPGIRLTVLL